MKTIKTLLLFACFFLAACDKLPSNGKLDGFWHLVEFAEKGEYSIDVSAEQRYWAFQHDLLNLRSTRQAIAPGYSEAFCRFQLTGDELIVSSIYLHPKEDRFDADDRLVTDEHTTLFQPFGIWGCRDKFQIEELTSKRLKLRSDHVQLTFRKF